MVFYLCRILEAKQSCELNPSKIESPTEACANAEFLLQVDYFNHLVSRFNLMMVSRCWMTLQNPSSCRAKRVPAHCATFVLACRGTSRTGAEISLDFGFEHYRFKFLLEHYRSGGRKRDL